MVGANRFETFATLAILAIRRNCVYWKVGKRLQIIRHNGFTADNNTTPATISISTATPTTQFYSISLGINLLHIICKWLCVQRHAPRICSHSFPVAVNSHNAYCVEKKCIQYSQNPPTKQGSYNFKCSRIHAIEQEKPRGKSANEARYLHVYPVLNSVLCAALWNAATLILR